MRTTTEQLEIAIKKSINDANAEGQQSAEIDLWMMLQHYAIVSVTRVYAYDNTGDIEIHRHRTLSDWLPLAPNSTWSPQDIILYLKSLPTG